MQKNKLNSGAIVSDLWHWRVEDDLDWEFCAGILAQNYGYEEGLSPDDVEKAFKEAFRVMYGYDVYYKCPGCEEGEIIPRDGPYNRFVSCSEFPSCKYKPKKGNVAIL